MEADTYKICSIHRDQLGIYWRGRRRTCQVPPNVANHKSGKIKGDPSVQKHHSVVIKQLSGIIVSVGSGKKKYVKNKRRIQNTLIRVGH